MLCLLGERLTNLFGKKILTRSCWCVVRLLLSVFISKLPLDQETENATPICPVDPRLPAMPPRGDRRESFRFQTDVATGNQLRAGRHRSGVITFTRKHRGGALIQSGTGGRGCSVGGVPSHFERDPTHTSEGRVWSQSTRPGGLGVMQPVAEYALRAQLQLSSATPVSGAQTVRVQRSLSCCPGNSADWSSG
ncbi:hypothetical protein AAFF_G00082860 [Aldrovandia affinis]|uniref:Uncharacterized protein n=1 Tax=Aldrovandia affinis TaxID=143900 RepID=A0AAD7WCC4_9TELE|nr:hypothetical protein AAFF_G00082860 [Aldrovandia affinis]